MPKSARHLSKINHNWAQEALGDSFWTTSAPRGPQDRKRDEKLGSLTAPRGSQRSLKIVIFVLKPDKRWKK